MPSQDGMTYAPSGPPEAGLLAGRLRIRGRRPRPRSHLRHVQRADRSRRPAPLGLRHRSGEGGRVPPALLRRRGRAVRGSRAVRRPGAARRECAGPRATGRAGSAGAGPRQALLHRQAADDHAGPARRGASQDGRDRQEVRDLLQRAAACGERGVRRATGRRRRHRTGAAGARHGAAPDEPGQAARLVLRPRGLRRDPLRHRQPPARAGALLRRLRRRDDHVGAGRQLRAQGPPGHRGLRRCHGRARQRRHRLLPGRLVHPRRPGHLG